MYKICTLTTTLPSSASASELIDRLVGDKLVACGSMHLVHSTYVWQGNITREKEWEIVLKTTLNLKSKLTVAVAELHPYEIPYIGCTEVEVNESYHRWVETYCTHRD